MDNIAQLGIKVDSSSIKQATNELSKLTNQSGKTEQSTTNLTSVFSKVNIAIIATSASLSSLAKHGIEYSNTIEKLTNGLITLNVMTSKNIDSNGKALTLEEKYNLARIESLDIMTKLNAINIETPHTLEQTVQIYKSMYTTMRSVNVSTEQMIDITKKLSIAAGSNGIEFQQLLAGIDGLATGTVEVSSELGRFLKSIGLTNESLKKSSNIYETINSKLKDVKGIESYDTAISNLTNSFDQLTGTLVQPFFEDIKSSINGLSKQFDTLKNIVKEIYPDDHLYTIMGADMFLTLDRWKNPKIIFEKSSIITIPRDDENKSELEKFYKNVLKPMGADAVILPNPVISVSSTFIRDNLDEFDLISGMLDKSVYDYIIKNNLYRK